MILTGSTWQEVIVGPRLLWLVSAASVLAPEESAFPGDLPAVVLVVLHRAWNRPTYLAETLIRHCLLPVCVANDDQRFRSGHVYIGRPEEHLPLPENSLGILIDDPEAVHRGRTADLLFRSVAAHTGSRMVGIVLRVALADSSRGLAAIHAAGGSTMVVSPAGPSKGMPENAIQYDGPISYVGRPEAIGAAACRLVQEERFALGGGQSDTDAAR